jgi:hypothetical protein
MGEEEALVPVRQGSLEGISTIYYTQTDHLRTFNMHFKYVKLNQYIKFLINTHHMEHQLQIDGSSSMVSF